MHTLYAGVHIQNKLSDVYPLHNIDLEQNVAFLKNLIAKELKLQIDATELEICHHGQVLDDSVTMSSTMKPNAIVHCFRKMQRYVPYVPPAAADVDSKHLQELFSLTSHLQITVTSRVTILQKILAEYPEFRRNLGAQALIRDSVLFNTLHEPEVVQNLVRDYPLICEAAKFIVDTIRKELARNSSATQFQEQTASDSTTSSEEENSLGAGSSSSSSSAATANRRDEMATIRQISRQQLANALARVDMSSFNSLSNIAQRNVDEAMHGDANASTSVSSVSSTAPSTAAGTSTERAGIPTEVFRNELARVFRSLQQLQPPPGAGTDTLDNDDAMAEATEDSMVVGEVDDDESAADDDSDVLPRCYRRHRYTEQLRIMAAMGFINHTQNANYLTLTDGNVEQAINLLMLGMN